MENLQEKETFLKSGFTTALRNLDEHAERRWGKMNVRQMIEHMADYVRIASGRTPMSVVTDAEMMPRMQAFLMSEKPFRENTPNALLPDTPPAPRLDSKEAAISELQDELDHFFDVHARDANRNTANPFFGELNYEQQVQLLHKHATHHLRQFGAL